MIPKFRAWVKEDKEMWPVHAIVYDNRIVWVEEPDNEDPSGCLLFDNVILMQSTGLKDKNNKEIFEGDIVRQVRTQPTTENETITGVVTMIEGAWLIMNDGERLASYLWSETDETEIMGNIYENPRLIK